MFDRVMSHGAIQSIFRTTDNAWIPLEPLNIDYQNFNLYLTANNISVLDLPIINIIL